MPVILNMGVLPLRNAVFIENPNNAWDNTLELIFAKDASQARSDHPEALSITIQDLHPTMGRMIERMCKRFSRVGASRK